MKNKLVAATLAALTLGATVPAFAASLDDVKFSGEVRARWFTEENANDTSNYRLRLVASKEVAPNLSFKARFAQENTVAGATTGLSMDQLSLKYAAGSKTTIVAGKDDAWLGAGLMMDNTFEGVQVKTAFDNVNFTAIAGHKAVGASAQTKFGSVAAGASYFDNKTTEKAWAVNTGFAIDNVNVVAEYAKNTKVDNDNNAYMIAATFGELAKKGDTNYVLGYNYLNVNAATSNTTLDLSNGTVSDIKGFAVTVNHKLADDVTVSLEQQFNKTVSTNTDNAMTRAQLLVKF